jgi:hypothetical protein
VDNQVEQAPVLSIGAARRKQPARSEHGLGGVASVLDLTAITSMLSATSEARQCFGDAQYLEGLWLVALHDTLAGDVARRWWNSRRLPP